MISSCLKTLRRIQFTFRIRCKPLLKLRRLRPTVSIFFSEKVFENCNSEFLDTLKAELVIVRRISSSLAAIKKLHRRHHKRHAPDVNRYRYVGDLSFRLTILSAQYSNRLLFREAIDSSKHEDDKDYLKLKRSMHYSLSCLFFEYNLIILNLKQYCFRKHLKTLI